MSDPTLLRIWVSATLLGTCVGWNPFSCVAALAVILAHSLVHKYFTSTIHDELGKSVASLKSDYSKIKARQDQENLKAAFGGKNG